MKAFIQKKYVNAGFVVSIIILLSINILAYLNIKEHLEDEGWTNNALMIIQSTEMLVSKLTDAESSRRGYLITGDEVFIRSHNSSIIQADSVFGSIRKLMAGNPECKALLDSLSLLMVERKRVMQSSFYYDRKSNEMQEQIEHTLRGRAALDAIKSIVERIQSGESGKLSRRMREAETSSSRTVVSLAVGSAVGVLILVLCIALINHNITQRIRFEKALEESRNWLSTTLRSIGDGVIVTNQLGDIVFINPVAESLTGWTEKEAKGVYLEHVFNVINEDTGKKIENPVYKVVKTGKAAGLANHSKLINKQGKEIPIDDSAAPVVADDGSALGVAIVFRDISQRRKAEIELLNSQRFIQRVADSIPNILYVYELTAPRVTYTNHKIEELLGYSSKDVIEMKEAFFKNLMHPDDFRKLRNRYKTYYNAKDSEIIENTFRIRNSRGEWKWLHSYDIIFTRDNDGSPLHILGTALDVTEKRDLEEELKKYNIHLEELVAKRTAEVQLTNERLQAEILEKIRAEREIAEAEEKFRSLVENSLAGIYIIQDQKFVYVNPKFEQIYGYEEDELIGKNINDLIFEADRELVNDNIRKRLNGVSDHIHYSYRGRRKNGEVFDVEIMGTKMEYSGKLAIIGTLNDITERLRSEKDLRESQQRLLFHVQRTPLGVIEWDLDFKVAAWNESAERIFGFAADEVLGTVAADFIVPEDNRELVYGVWRDLLTQSGGSRSTNMNVTKSGKRILCEWYNTPLIDNYGRVIGVASLVEDISERKLAEDGLKKSLKEKELLLKEIHHRVKNNLQIIVSLLKLQAKYIFDSRDYEILNKSRTRIETMSLIHEKLYKSQDLANIDMDAYVRDLTVHLLKAYSDSIPLVNISVCSDNVSLGIDTAIPCGLIITELVSNALKHAFSNKKKGTIKVELTHKDDSILLSVSDNGIGLPKDFDVCSAGSLGLQLVNTLVKQLDGKLNVRSIEGTVFEIEFQELKYTERI